MREPNKRPFTKKSSDQVGKDVHFPASSIHIAVIGLGYVGLPLALAFSEKYKVVGFDIHKPRIKALKKGEDITLQVHPTVLDNCKVKFTNSPSDIHQSNVYIITVPTPVDEFKKPNLDPLIQASKTVGGYLKKGDVVIYESTVYPGCTEEDGVPILEEFSGLTYNVDFFCGYSPERISPGENTYTLKKIIKVTSGSTPAIADFVDQLYASIIDAGTYKAPSIKVAEASKAIENAQRDLNISFVNELSLICDRIGIDTTEVLEAASTKPGFLKFKPGLVGGHCICVDPYYLAYKAESLGYHPQLILSGRRVNDLIGAFVVNKVLKLMVEKGAQLKGSKILILGLTFKENCPDMRNSQVIDIYRELLEFGLVIDVYDPWASLSEAKSLYGIDLIEDIHRSSYEAILLAVAHKEFLSIDFSKLKGPKTVIFDTKAVIDRKLIDARL